MAPPTLTAPANVTTSATSAAGAVVTYTTPTAADFKDGSDPVVCLAASGSTFAIGATTVTCSSTNSSNMTTTHTFTVTVSKLTPVIAWAAPSSIFYGDALGTSQLNATANVAGTFAYSPAAGTVLAAGAHSLSLTFTPDDRDHYTGVTASTDLTVLKATPQITWPKPSDVIDGYVLGPTQLNATASVPGTFAYTPTSGAVWWPVTDMAVDGQVPVLWTGKHRGGA